MKGLLGCLGAVLLTFVVFCAPVAVSIGDPFSVEESSATSTTPVIDLPFHETTLVAPGWEERGIEFRKWLAPSVRIGGGSGTMVYYDPEENYMYVISCGHLFNRGRGSADSYKSRPKTMTVEVFYHNNQKLDQVREYKAEVLCHVWGEDGVSSVYDVSLMRFKPDWADPWYLPIASEKFRYIEDKMYHSCGCDGRSEVAHYLVRFVKEQTQGEITEIVTKENGPRGGRSGGGVFTDDGELIAICSRGGGGYGYWTSLNQIHRFLKEEGYGFVLQGASLARKIPIVDMNGPQREYPKDYIPLPSH